MDGMYTIDQSRTVLFSHNRQSSIGYVWVFLSGDHIRMHLLNKTISSGCQLSNDTLFTAPTILAASVFVRRLSGNWSISSKCSYFRGQGQHACRNQVQSLSLMDAGTKHSVLIKWVGCFLYFFDSVIAFNEPHMTAPAIFLSKRSEIIEAQSRLILAGQNHLLRFVTSTGMGWFQKGFMIIYHHLSGLPKIGIRI